MGAAEQWEKRGKNMIWPKALQCMSVPVVDDISPAILWLKPFTDCSCSCYHHNSLDVVQIPISYFWGFIVLPMCSVAMGTWWSLGVRGGRGWNSAQWPRLESSFHLCNKGGKEPTTSGSAGKAPTATARGHAPGGRDHAPGSASLPPWSPAPGAGPRPLRRGSAPSALLFGARALLHCFAIILHWEADSKGYLRLQRFLATGHTSKCLLIFAVLFRMCF